MSEWRPVVGWEGIYEVSSVGGVHSHHRYNMRPRKVGLDPYGYVQLVLSRDGKKVCKKVHSLVAEAFIGPRPYGFHVNHLDGVKTNNSVENLEYCTNCENIKHALKLGLFAKGEKNGAAKLTEAQVQEIRRLYVPHSCLTGVRPLARRFHMSPYAIQAIVTHIHWKHLPKILKENENGSGSLESEVG